MSKTTEEIQKNVEKLIVETTITSLKFLQPKLQTVTDKVKAVIESLEAIKEEK